MMRLRRVLVPLDFSKETELALDWAIKLAREEPDSTLVLLHVVEAIPIIPDPLMVDRWTEVYTTKQWDRAEEKLQEFQKRIPPGLSSIAMCRDGDVTSAICKVSKEERVDLIVMTTHGRQGLEQILHPNLTERVVRMASCPVLVLHLTPHALMAVAS